MIDLSGRIERSFPARNEYTFFAETREIAIID